MLTLHPRTPDMQLIQSFADGIAAGIEGGADSDLVFALLQIQMEVVGMSDADEADLSMGFAPAEDDERMMDYEGESPPDEVNTYWTSR